MPIKLTKLGSEKCHDATQNQNQILNLRKVGTFVLNIDLSLNDKLPHCCVSVRTQFPDV